MREMVHVDDDGNNNGQAERRFDDASHE
jgi:hypothetical protein